MPKKPSDFDLSRRAALAGAMAVGGGAAACATANDAGLAQPEAFQGRIGPTFAQSSPDFGRERGARTGAPNIVVVILDDVGFADLSCYGSEIETPAMDALAAGGLRYTNFRTTGVCSSTRASLLTGLNPHSAGLGWLAVSDEGYPGYRGDLARDAATLAETFAHNGYLTYHVGKWHVNADASATAVGPFENWPLQRGYHRAHWFQGHSLNYFRPSNIFDGNQRVEIEDEAYLATDAFTDNAIRYLNEHKAQACARPFFMTIAYGAAHSPLHAPEADIAEQRGRYDVGWDVVRQRRLLRQLELGVVPDGTQLPPRNNGVSPWSDLSADQRRLYARYMELYAAVLKRTDSNIGRLTRALAELDALENTVIMVFSDNGGSPDGGLGGTPNLLASGSGGVSLSDALAQIDAIGGADTYPMYPMGWAMASNTPYKMYKHDTHLGGVADPLIVHWPRGIEARGEVRSHYIHVSDIFPTLIAIADAQMLVEVGERRAKPVQGVDFSSTYARADAPPIRTEQHFELNGTRALYAEGWRLVSKGRFQQPGDGWELYNLSHACNELTDIAAENPGKVAELEARWLAAARRCDVFPIDTRTIREKSWAPLLREQHRARWELTPPLDLLMEESAPPLIGRAHTIDITLARPLRRGDEGVLYAAGNVFLGSALFIQNGKLIHEFSCAPRTLRTETAAPLGATRIAIRHHLTQRPWQGSVELLADGARRTLQHHEPMFFGRPMQGLQIGRNGSTPASYAYQRPFTFTGALARVVIDVDASAYTQDEIATLMRPPQRA